jgi:hypothetical protein
VLSSKLRTVVGLALMIAGSLVTSGAAQERDGDDPPRRRDDDRQVREERQPPNPSSPESPFERRPGAPRFDGPDGFRPPGPGGPGGPGRDGVNGLQAPRPPFGRIDWEQLKKYDPEMYELELRDLQLEQRTLSLAEQMRRAPAELQRMIREELAESVAQHFDVRQQRRRLQLKRLEEELAKAREAIERREQARDELVTRRIGELSGDVDPLDF